MVIIILLFLIFPVLSACANGARDGALLQNQKALKAYSVPYEVTEQPDISESTSNLPRAYFGDNLPDVAKKALAVLKKKRPPRYVAEQAALVKGADNGDYLIVKCGGFDGYPQVEFHRLWAYPDGKIKLKLLRKITGPILSIAEPTGREVFPGEPPVAVVVYGGGGSSLSNYYIHAIQLRNNTVDIVPERLGRPVDLIDLDGDKSFELVTIDERWRALYDGRGAAGPHIPVFFRRKEGKFVPACRDFSSLYRKEIEGLYGFLDKNDGPWNWETIASIILMYAQIGEFEKAQALYEKMLRDIDLYVNTEKDLYYTDYRERSEKRIGTAIESARTRPMAQCSLFAGE